MGSWPRRSKERRGSQSLRCLVSLPPWCTPLPSREAVMAMGTLRILAAIVVVGFQSKDVDGNPTEPAECNAIASATWEHGDTNGDGQLNFDEFFSKAWT